VPVATTEQDAATRVIARGAPRMPANVRLGPLDVVPSSQSWSCSAGAYEIPMIAPSGDCSLATV
jgi:hypothetical protein